MTDLRIYFTDFFDNYEEDMIPQLFMNIFPNAIHIKDPIDVDLCIYSCFGKNHENIDARYKISYMGEPHYGQFNYGFLNNADLNIGFDYPKNSRQFRFPLWNLSLLKNHLCDFNFEKLNDLMLPRTSKWFDPVINTIPPICAMYRHFSGIRSTLIPLLVDEKICASYGMLYPSHIVSKDYKNIFKVEIKENGHIMTDKPVLYEVEIGHVDKESITKLHPFHAALENCQEEGYVTEKLFEPLYYGSVPFYWGDKRGSEDDFNPSAFVSLAHFDKNEGDKAVAYIKNILAQPALCTELRKAPIFINKPDFIPLYNAVRNVVYGYD
jgi:hypothetical protein